MASEKAAEEANVMDEKIRQHFLAEEIIVFCLEGDGDGEFRGGPVRRAGYYVMPFCDPMCCRPYGPFEDRAVARAWYVLAAEGNEPEPPSDD